MTEPSAQEVRARILCAVVRRPDMPLVDKVRRTDGVPHVVYGASNRYIDVCMKYASADCVQGVPKWW